MKDKNDPFVNLRGNDLKELLVQVENYHWNYRNDLNLPKNETFGTEIEYEDVSKKKVDDFIRTYKDWESKLDGSIIIGGEITSPIMHDEKQYWRELKEICTFLKKEKASTSGNAGGHIHIGADILKNDVEAWKRFISMYTIYEHLLFRFSYGDKISARKKIEYHARPIADQLHKNMKYILSTKKVDNFEYNLPDERRIALNFLNVNFSHVQTEKLKHTLEFRMPNATTNEIIWQNNINTFTKMLLSCNNNQIDTEYLNYKLNQEFIPYHKNKSRYNEVCLKEALEFVDFIFDNNLDKIIFLKQYIKGFEMSHNKKPASTAKIFMK